MERDQVRVTSFVLQLIQEDDDLKYSLDTPHNMLQTDLPLDRWDKSSESMNIKMELANESTESGDNDTNNINMLKEELNLELPLDKRNKSSESIVNKRRLIDEITINDDDVKCDINLLHEEIDLGTQVVKAELPLEEQYESSESIGIKNELIKDSDDVKYNKNALQEEPDLGVEAEKNLSELEKNPKLHSGTDADNEMESTGVNPEDQLDVNIEQKPSESATVNVNQSDNESLLLLSSAPHNQQNSITQQMSSLLSTSRDLMRQKRKSKDKDIEAFLEIEREKVKVLRQNHQNNSDDDLLWFKSMLPYLRQLPPLNKLNFRIKMQGLLLKKLSNSSSDVSQRKSVISQKKKKHEG